MRPALRKLHRSHPILKAARAYKRVWKGICGGATWNDINHNFKPMLAQMAQQTRESAARASRTIP